MDPGSAVPDHQHMLNEQTYVIKGYLVCNEGECKAGEFVWRPAGSRHSSWSPNGGTMLGTFQVPHKTFKTDNQVDILNQNWYNSWGKCTNMLSQK